MEIMKRKRFFVWTMDKEKQYLEEMARSGFILTRVKLFKYYFEKSESIDYVYEFDFQFLVGKKEDDYLSFFQDWELVLRYGGWYYFRKIRTNTEQDTIYSDNESKSQMFKRLIAFICITGAPMYYQLLIVFPSIENTQTSIPNFYSFFKYVLYIMVPIHMFAVFKISQMYLRFSKKIKE